MAEIDEIINEPSEASKRISQLSGEVKQVAEEREAAQKAADEAKAAAEEASRERDFYAGFADIVADNPAAKDHKDDILTKVKSGYTVQDATFAVLGAAGKIGTPVSEPEVIAGGSATTTPPSTVTKTVKEMDVSELRNALVEAENRGDLSIT